MCSSLLLVTSGVPQGSILGPLLFLLFVNDLPSRTKSFPLLLFADDCKCVATIKSPSDQTLLQEDLDHLVQWTYEWLLSVNQSKCKSLRITHSFSQSPSQPYCISGSCNIEQSSQQRDLGVIFCDDLSWSQYYNKVISKAYSILFFSDVLFLHFTLLELNVLYISCIHSCLT